VTELFQQPIFDAGTTTAEVVTPEVQAAEAEYQRVFYRSDYSRFAAAIRRARKVMRTYADPKPAGAQAVIDSLTAVLVQVFTEDSEQAGSSEKDAFNAEFFTESTKLEVSTTITRLDDEEEDDEDEDEDEDEDDED
jgi:hypothetical protein